MVMVERTWSQNEGVSSAGHIGNDRGINKILIGLFMRNARGHMDSVDDVFDDGGEIGDGVGDVNGGQEIPDMSTSQPFGEIGDGVGE